MKAFNFIIFTYSRIIFVVVILAIITYTPTTIYAKGIENIELGTKFSEAVQLIEQWKKEEGAAIEDIHFFQDRLDFYQNYPIVASVGERGADVFICIYDPRDSSVIGYFRSFFFPKASIPLAGYVKEQLLSKFGKNYKVAGAEHGSFSYDMVWSESDIKLKRGTTSFDLIRGFINFYVQMGSSLDAFEDAFENDYDKLLNFIVKALEITPRASALLKSPVGDFDFSELSFEEVSVGALSFGVIDKIKVKESFENIYHLAHSQKEEENRAQRRTTNEREKNKPAF
jgi:hypothetical protein